MSCPLELLPELDMGQGAQPEPHWRFCGGIRTCTKHKLDSGARPGGREVQSVLSPPALLRFFYSCPLLLIPLPSFPSCPFLSMAVLHMRLHLPVSQPGVLRGQGCLV